MAGVQQVVATVSKDNSLSLTSILFRQPASDLDSWLDDD